MRAEIHSVGGRRVQVWRGGEGSPLVLLHGAVPDAQRCWSKIWDRLAERYDVIAPDLPGCGGSQALPRSDLGSLAAWLEGLLNVLDLRSVALVGGDAGAAIGRAFATSHPHRCHSLVLINGGLVRERLGDRLGLTVRRQPTAHTLVFWTQDNHRPPDGGPGQLARQLPRAALRLMPGMGRLPQIEAPEETAEVLTAFLG
jgi:pimeloyl-ACP methyl ester carboxylesterase